MVTESGLNLLDYARRLEPVTSRTCGEHFEGEVQGGKFRKKIKTKYNEFKSMYQPNSFTVL